MQIDVLAREAAVCPKGKQWTVAHKEYLQALSPHSINDVIKRVQQTCDYLSLLQPVGLNNEDGKRPDAWLGK